MDASFSNKKKILNDPVYGFISFPSEIFFDLVEHRYFQRLRRIKQLGLTHLVYPGALHTRFHHALGCLHLMQLALNVLRSKGHDITAEEAEGVCLAILLHDIGHGPFSHALENSIVSGTSHEALSDLFMDRLDEHCGGKLALATAIFRDRYPKRYLHKMIAGQLDMDRLDYLKRDSFYTGVSEGVISADRIIQMLNIADDELVVDAKGIYSIEKFIIARRLMYWQVYLHKTVLGAEQLLIRILLRARELATAGEVLFATPALAYFLGNACRIEDFERQPALLDIFAALDDFDVLTSIKVWQEHKDPILANLSQRLIGRRLLRTLILDEAPSQEEIDMLRQRWAKKDGSPISEAHWFVFGGRISNKAYDENLEPIHILYRDGRRIPLTEASEHIHLGQLSQVLTKYFLCYPKELEG